MADLNALVYTPLAELRASLEKRLKDLEATYSLHSRALELIDEIPAPPWAQPAIDQAKERRDEYLTALIELRSVVYWLSKSAS